MALDFHLNTPHDAGLQSRLGDVLARKLAAADTLGRIQILRHARKKTGLLLPLSPAAHTVRFGQDGDMGFSFDVGGAENAQQIQGLTAVTHQVFDGLTAQYRKDAFTLAGVADVRLIERIRDELAETARQGETVDDFRKAVNRITSEAGVADLHAFTLDTAFQTAMQKAYSAGRLEQMREPHMVEALPFWQYWTVGDLRVRPEHAVLDGFLARAIDPVWRKIYPPSGFNCRCSVVPIPADEALKIDPQCEEGGWERLPAMARMLVPQSGFTTLAHM